MSCNNCSILTYQEMIFHYQKLLEIEDAFGAIEEGSCKVGMKTLPGEDSVLKHAP